MRERIDAIRSKTPVKGNVLTVDGIHMNALGNIVMAETILRGMGLNEDQLDKARKLWSKQRFPLNDGITLSVAEYRKLSEKAFAAGKSVPDFVAGLILNEIK